MTCAVHKEIQGPDWHVDKQQGIPLERSKTQKDKPAKWTTPFHCKRVASTKWSKHGRSPRCILKPFDEVLSQVEGWLKSKIVITLCNQTPVTTLDLPSLLLAQLSNTGYRVIAHNTFPASAGGTLCLMDWKESVFHQKQLQSSYQQPGDVPPYASPSNLR